MSHTVTELTRKSCTECEGDAPALSHDECNQYLKALPKWKLVGEKRRIRREWRVKDFETALKFFNEIGALAENEGHHPDLHLTEYRDVEVELSTHAVKGLTENDFILAAKIDQIPVKLKG